MSDGQDVLVDRRRAGGRSWLLADGRGAFAAGTAAGAATRRAHALLAVPGPAGPRVALLRFDDRAGVGAQARELTPAFVAAPGVRPGATAALEAFTDDPWPTWRLGADGWVLERSLRLVDGHPALLATWRLLAGANLRLAVAPLLVARALRGLQRERADFRGAAQGIPGRVRLETAPGEPGVTLWHNGAFVPARAWQRGLAYPLDDPGDAGEPPVEDAFVPGWVQAELGAPGAALHVVVSPEEGLFRALATEQRLGTPPAGTLADCLARLDDAARARAAARTHAALRGADFTARQAAAAHAEGGDAPRTLAPLVDAGDPLTAPLARLARAALVARPARTGALAGGAGGERGAEALRIATGLVAIRDFEAAQALAAGALEFLDEGLAPAGFSPDGAPEHGDPEPSLWLVHVVDLLVRRGTPPGAPADAPAPEGFLRAAWPALEGVLHHLRSGSGHGVHCDREGLLWWGEGAAAEARADHNALWYHALVAMSQLGRLIGRREHAAFYLAWAHELQRGYLERFWDARCGCLFEALTPAGPRRGLSPPQLWAVALSPQLLPAAAARTLLARVDRELLTPTGLRPAPDAEPADPAWLGPWAAATLRAHGRDAAARARVRARFEHLVADWEARGVAALGPRPFLAAAEILRAWIEELDREVASAPSA